MDRSRLRRAVPGPDIYEAVRQFSVHLSHCRPGNPWRRAGDDAAGVDDRTVVPEFTQHEQVALDQDGLDMSR